MPDFDAWDSDLSAPREAKASQVGGEWFDQAAAYGYQSQSGIPVTWRTALDVTTVLACCRVLAEGVSQVPCRVMRQRAGGQGADIATDHPLYDLLNRRPNSWQTSFEYRETIMLHLVLTNNHFSFKSRVRGQIHELIPLEPARMAVTRHDDMSLSYVYTPENGTQVRMTQDDVWHIRGPSWNSWLGLEAVKLARESIGLALSIEQTSARFQKNAARPSGLLSIEATLTPEKHKLFVEQMKKTARENTGDPLISDQGAKWTPFLMTGVDMQLIESRKYQTEEICRAFRVMPIMVGQADKTATYASAEQMFLAHVIHSLTPWCERIEQSADVNLLGATNDRDYYVHLDLKGLMRGAAKDRADYFSKALGSGGSPAWMTQDEVRDEEDQNPMGGDAANLPAQLGSTPKPPTAPGDPPEPVA